MPYIPPNTHYVPSYVDLINTIRFLHLTGNYIIRDQLIYHISISIHDHETISIYMGQHVGNVSTTRKKLLILQLKRLGIYDEQWT